MSSSKEISASTTRSHKKFQPLVVELTTSYVRGQTTARNLKDWRVTLMEGVAGKLSASVGNGWRGILERTFEGLRRDGWNGSIGFTNITCKHAGLVVTFGSHPTMNQLMLARIAQMQSYSTCSRCGSDGFLTYRGRLAEILCGKCSEFAKKEDPDGNQPAYRIQT